AAYPGNGTDAAIDVGINGSPDFQPTNVHSVAAGDAIRLTFHSPNGTLTANPFLALAQIYTTGFPATPLQLPGDAMATVMLDLSSPISALVNGLANPGTFLNPILDDYSIVGNIPLGTSGLNISAMIVLLVTDPGLNPVNLGNAPAHELAIL
ncbi:MAG: hypothetical protein KDB53_18130, partial [Planctomycetes bacterium]|nr:hypothetical protein [Planctomycetota bacterium]